MKKNIAALGILLLGLTGCAVNLGNSTPDKSQPTLGEQLIDLKKAHDKGAISEQDYETQRRRLMDQYQVTK